jgi:hypothetical protein
MPQELHSAAQLLQYSSQSMQSHASGSPQFGQTP